MWLIVLVIVLILAFGGGFYGRRAGYAGYGYVGYGLGGLLLVILIVWLLLGGVGYHL